MLTINQFCILYPHHSRDHFDNEVMKRSPRRCLFGSPDPLETKKLLEEQFLADREMMLRKYGFDILTSRLITTEDELSEHDSVDSDRMSGDIRMVDIPTLDQTSVVAEAEEDGSSSTASEVRHRPERHTPYTRQSKITDYWRVRKNITQSKNNRTSNMKSPPHDTTTSENITED